MLQPLGASTQTPGTRSLGRVWNFTLLAAIFEVFVTVGSAIRRRYRHRYSSRWPTRVTLTDSTRHNGVGVPSVRPELSPPWTIQSVLFHLHSCLSFKASNETASPTQSNITQSLTGVRSTAVCRKACLLLVDLLHELSVNQRHDGH